MPGWVFEQKVECNTFNVWMDYGEVDGWSGEGWMDGYSFNCYYYKSTGSGSAKETLLARRPFLPLTC